MGKSLPWVAIFFGVCLGAYTLGWAFLGYPIYRDQHLGAALHYATNGIDLLRPVIPGFNATGTGTPQELPLWQALAAWALRWGNGWWGAASIISLLIFFALLPFFWRLAKNEGESSFAWLALIFLLSQPLVFHLAGGAQTDGFSLALLLGFVWSTEWLRRDPGTPSWVVCAILASLLAVTKFPYLMTGGFAAALMLLWQRASLKLWLLLTGAAVAAAAVFLPWNAWCNAEIGRALFKYRPMTISENPEWFFGSLAYRLDPANYVKAGWRALSCLWGSFALVGLTFYGLWKNPRSLGACLLYGAILTTLIFTKLVLIHRHYYLMFAPAVALLNATALSYLFPHPKKVISFCLAPLLLLSLAQGLLNMEVVATGDPYVKRMGATLAANTSADEKVLVLGGGWGGDIFLHSGREGLSVDNSSLAENPETRRQLRDLGYTKIAWISESPLLHALQVTNTGETCRLRERFPVRPPVGSSTWPTVYQSEEIVIKQMPAP